MEEFMKVCVTATGPGLEAEIDPRFGRCSYFVFYNLDDDSAESIENPNLAAAGGVGVQSGQLMSEKQVGVVLTGNVGPNAFATLNAANISVVTGVSGTVGETIEKYKNGELAPTSGPTVAKDAGKTGFSGGGRAGGMGRGGGQGRGGMGGPQTSGS